MGRRSGAAALTLALLVAGCRDPRDLFLPVAPAPDVAALLFVYELPGGALRILAVDVRAGVPALRLEGLTPGARIWSLHLADDLEALGLAPGEVPQVQPEGRALPPAVRVERAVLGQGPSFTVLEGLEPPLTDLRIPALPVGPCAEAGGCFLSPGAAACNTPCPEPRGIAIPDVPLPAALPAPVDLGPCRPGWREVSQEGLRDCRPPPRAPACPAGTWQPLGEAGCVALGPPCPAGAWPEDLPLDRTVVYAQAGASGGDGTRAAPLGSLGAALARVPPGGLVALAKGTFTEQVTLQKAGVTVRGACVAETRVAAESGADAVTLAADGVALEQLTVAGPRNVVLAVGEGTALRQVVVEVGGFAGVYAARGQVDLHEVRLQGGPGRAVVAVEGARLVGAGVQVEGTATGVVVEGAAAALTDLVLQAPALTDEGPGRGLLAVDGQLVVTGLLVEAAASAAVRLESTTATLTDALLTGCGTGTTAAPALEVLEGSDATLARLHVDDSGSWGVRVVDSRARVRGLAVARSPRTVPTTGMLAGLWVSASDVALSGVHLRAGGSRAGYFTGGSVVVLEDATVLGVGGVADPAVDRLGLHVDDAVALTGRRLHLEGVDGRVLLLGGLGTSADLEDLTIVSGSEDPERYTTAITVDGLVEVNLRRYHMTGVRGLDALGPLARLHMTDVELEGEGHASGPARPGIYLKATQATIRRLRCTGRTSWCVYGIDSGQDLEDLEVTGGQEGGLHLSGPLEDRVVRAWFYENHGASIMVDGGAWAKLEDVRVELPRRQVVECDLDCAGAALRAKYSGFWENVAVPSRAEVRRFVFVGGDDLALDLLDPAHTLLEDGLIRDFPTAVRALGEHDLAALLVRVRYEDIDTFLEAVAR